MTEHFAEVGCYRARMSGSAEHDLLAIETLADLYCRHWRYQSPKNYAMNPSRFDLLGFVQSNPGWGYRQCSSRRNHIDKTKTDESTDRAHSDDHNTSRLRLGIESFIVGIASSALTILIYTAIWDRQERLNGSIEQYNWAPVHDLDGMLMLMPVGFFLYFFLPPGWFFWAGFILAQRYRNRSFHGLCALGGCTFGFTWPKHCVGMLGI